MKNITKIISYIDNQLVELINSQKTLVITIDILNELSDLKKCNKFDFRNKKTEILIVKQYLWSIIKSSYRTIYINLCNLYEKTNSSNGLFTRLEKELIKANRNDLQVFCKKPYKSNKEIVLPRHKFYAHIDVDSDVYKFAHHIYKDTEELLSYIKKSSNNLNKIVKSLQEIDYKTKNSLFLDNKLFDKKIKMSILKNLK